VGDVQTAITEKHQRKLKRSNGTSGSDELHEHSLPEKATVSWTGHEFPSLTAPKNITVFTRAVTGSCPTPDESSSYPHILFLSQAIQRRVQYPDYIHVRSMLIELDRIWKDAVVV
jgi:hypothetical protein